jgi:hypothetical protein
MHARQERIGVVRRMDTAERTALILRKLDDGSLPAKPCAVLWGGTGTGAACAGCDEPINPSQIEFECHGEDGVIVHICRSCYSAWDAQIARRL